MFFVIEESKCLECNGAGFIDNPVYKEFFETNLESTKENMQDFFKKRGLSSLPPTLIDCPMCNGEGILHKMVELKEALERLGYVISIRRSS